MEEIISQRMMAKNLQLHTVVPPPMFGNSHKSTRKLEEEQAEYGVFLKPLLRKKHHGQAVMKFDDEAAAQQEKHDESEDNQPLLVVKTDSAVTLGVVVDALHSEDTIEDDLSPNLRARVSSC